MYANKIRPVEKLKQSASFGRCGEMSDTGEQQDCGWPFLNHCKSGEAAMDTNKSQPSFLHHRVISAYESGCCDLPQTIRWIISRVWVCVSQKIQLLVRIKTPEGCSFFYSVLDWFLQFKKKEALIEDQTSMSNRHETLTRSSAIRVESGMITSMKEQSRKINPRQEFLTSQNRKVEL